MRHGEAENKSESPGKDDSSRRLTESGRNEVTRVCELAKKFGANPRTIVSSPLIRAKQTAEVAREIFSPKAGLRSDDCLEPESNAERVYEYISRIDIEEREEILLVTHLPLLADFVVDFVNLKEARANFEIKPASIVKIDSGKTIPQSGSGTMVWLLPQR